VRFLSTAIVIGTLGSLAACSSPAQNSTSSGSGASSGGATSGGSGGTGGDTGAGGMAGGPPIGGDRPVDVVVPSTYSPGKPAPLLILLHGYSVGGKVEELYMHFAPLADKYGFLYAYPDGTVDKSGKRFWNATDACCNFDGSSVDDSGYLSSVIDEIEKAYSVDPKRIYLVGHSNGGFMAYRMACDHAGKIAAIVSLAGATWQDTSKCKPESPVSVLQVHGTADPEVAFDGAPGLGSQGNGPYPGAETTVQDWATLDGCSLTPDKSSPPLDLDTMLAGAETTVEKYAQGCKPGGGAELWAIQGGGHIPSINDTFREGVFSYLMAHPKP
jgi:polyhydroxybutyrate depolymerase